MPHFHVHVPRQLSEDEREALVAEGLQPPPASVGAGLDPMRTVHVPDAPGGEAARRRVGDVLDLHPDDIEGLEVRQAGL